MQWEIERIFNPTGELLQSLIEDLLIEQLEQIKTGEIPWK